MIVRPGSKGLGSTLTGHTTEADRHASDAALRVKCLGVTKGSHLMASLV